MQRYKSEGPIWYSRYQFGYCEWLELEREELNRPELAYSGGFLPYSARPEDSRDLFYMARSLRVDLEHFSLGKSRRYDHRTWLTGGLRREVLEKAEFLDRHGAEYAGLAEGWMRARFGEPYLDANRLGYIMAKPFLNTVLCWHGADGLNAFALVVRSSAMAHYWYAFYRTGDEKAVPGHGYLTDFLEWARDTGLAYAYLGTAYGNGSRYKARGLRGVEFWDGNGWNSDKEALRHLQAEDSRVHRPAQEGFTDS